MASGVIYRVVYDSHCLKKAEFTAAFCLYSPQLLFSMGRAVLTWRQPFQGFKMPNKVGNIQIAGAADDFLNRKVRLHQLAFDLIEPEKGDILRESHSDCFLYNRAYFRFGHIQRVGYEIHRKVFTGKVLGNKRKNLIFLTDNVLLQALLDLFTKVCGKFLGGTAKFAQIVIGDQLGPIALAVRDTVFLCKPEQGVGELAA